jgi:DNA primase catalytic subunit
MKQFKHYLKEELDKEALNEGLISSYDSNKLIIKIKKLLNNNIQNIQTPNLSDILTNTKYGKIFTIEISLFEPLTPVQSQQLDTLLNVYGYVNSVGRNSSTRLQLEPKYPVLINKFIEENNDRNLYHITQKKHLVKIQTIGLTPKESQTTFDHPNDRIYLMWLPNVESPTNILQSFSRVLARNKQVRSEDMTILETQYNPNSEYYLDDTATIIERNIVALYTTNNIKPDKLKLLE